MDQHRAMACRKGRVLKMWGEHFVGHHSVHQSASRPKRCKQQQRILHNRERERREDQNESGCCINKSNNLPRSLVQYHHPRQRRGKGNSCPRFKRDENDMDPLTNAVCVSRSKRGKQRQPILHTIREHWHANNSLSKNDFGRCSSGSSCLGVPFRSTRGSSGCFTRQ